MNQQTLQIKQVRWQDAKDELRRIRTEVFIKEQKVPEELEWDNQDQNCMHLLVLDNENAIATARLLATGQIGRMAILAPYRQQGIGTAMLQKLFSIADKMNIDTVFLNAQTDAITFYKKFGFIEQGDLFNDAGIMHKRMVKSINLLT